MQLVLKNIVPRYLENNDSSEVWNRTVSLDKGEHLHIVAPSGSGKSTLIHFIYRLRKDYSGDIFLDHEPVKRLSVEKLAAVRQRHISIVFQDLRLFPGLSVLENIEIKRRLAPYHSPDDIKKMAKRLHIENKLTQDAGTCSYGEQQRVAIVRSLMQPFDFLLLDEPFSHLDEANRRSAMELIYEECGLRKASMIFADLKKLDFLSKENCLHL